MTTHAQTLTRNSADRPAAQGHMRVARWLPAAARIAIGLVFFVFGLNGFLDFVPHPTTPPPAGAMAFFLALMKTGYMLPLISATELAAGALLLANRFVPLALVLLAPVLVNIAAYHLFLDHAGGAIAAALVAIELYLAWTHRAAFRPLFGAGVLRERA